MRTSISEVIRTERFLQGELEPQERILYEARLLVDSNLRANLFFHRVLHRLLRFYRRKQMRGELEAIHERLFQDPAKAVFRAAVVKHFKARQ